MLNDKYKLIKDKTVGQDIKVDAILSSSDTALSALYLKAYSLYSSQLKRGYVEASLLCEPSLAKIGIVLDLSEEVLELYQEIFFDTRGFDKLSKIEYIDSIEDDGEKTLKLWALGQGLDFISWRLGNRVVTSPIDGLVEMFSTCMYKAKESVYSSNTSESSKEAIKWTKMSADIARLLKVWTLDSAAAKKDLEIAIQDVVPDFMGIDALLEENKQ